MQISDTPEHTSREAPPVPTFSMKQAASVAGVSVSTLRRRRTELEAAGAVISSDGWKVPITALEALGLMGSSTSKVHQGEVPATHTVPVSSHQLEELDKLRERVIRLQDENRELRHRAELAEAIARERAEALNAERMALRMIAASPSSSSSSPHDEERTAPSSTQHQPATSMARPSWWKKKFG